MQNIFIALFVSYKVRKNIWQIEFVAFRAQRETFANPIKIPPCGRNDTLPLVNKANQIGGRGRQFDLPFS